VDTYTVSPDGKTFTFHLRKGVLFQDGSEMTSADVLASFQRWEALSSRAQALLKNMTSATAPDPYTFAVQFSQPNGAFISALAIPNQQMFILEKKQIDQYMSGGKYQQIPGAQLIGTGPYRIQQWQPGRELDLVRFDKYVSPSGPSNGLAGTRHAYVDEIKYVTVPDPSSTVAGLAAGQYDVAYTLLTSLYGEVQAQSGLVPEVVKPGSSPVAVFNKKEGPFTSVALRQAAWYAIDPAKVMAGAIDNKAFYSMDPSLADKDWAVWYNDQAGASVYKGAPDPAKVKQLLQQAGYTGQPLIWITTKDYELR
jgi:peptide/nickel transport system substrate-binding protein